MTTTNSAVAPTRDTAPSATSAQSEAIPRFVYFSVAGGLVLMAFFTLLWASWAFAGLMPPLAVPIVGIFAVFAAIFVVEAVRLIHFSRRVPPVGPSTAARVEPREAEHPRRMSRGAWFGTIFAAEGVVIFVVCAILGKSGLTDFINPAIALIVGLHFIPLARLFGRTLDYYVAGWFVVASVTGTILIATAAAPTTLVWSLVAVAAACGTSVYGFYMIGAKRSLLTAARSGWETGVTR